MSRTEHKVSRLLQIEALLLAHPEGLSQAEIARRLKVNRSTIHRDLQDVPGHISEDQGRVFIDRSAYLVNVRFNLNEAMALHLATRLLATRMDRQNRHAAAALRKLGTAIDSLAPCVSTHMQRSADDMDAPSRRHDPVYLTALEALTTAWAELRTVHVFYRPESGELHEYDFCPYFIEPYAIGQSTYVFGWRTPPGELRTMKIERIEKIDLLDQPYTIPADFDPQVLLANAWGIWYSDTAPFEVLLRFSPKIARRVQETCWHRSETTEEQSDGSLLWRAWIANPIEMEPWIRGWGPEVEVLAPPNLRKTIAANAHRTASLYPPEI